MAKRKTTDDPKQAATFRKAARELGCDANEERFQGALRKIAKAKPSPQAEKQAASKHGKDR